MTTSSVTFGSELTNYVVTRIKYKLTENQFVLLDGTVLHQIVSTFKNPHAQENTYGGWVEHEGNLSHYDDCWIGPNVIVYGDAVVRGNAFLYGNNSVSDHALIEDDVVVSGNATISGWAVIRGSVKVAEDATITGTAVIEERAEILGDKNSIIDGGYVYGDCKLSGPYRISDKARVYGNAKVETLCYIYENAQVYGNCFITKRKNDGGTSEAIESSSKYKPGVHLYGSCEVFGNVWISDAADVSGNAKIFGGATVSNYAVIKDYAVVRDQATVTEQCTLAGNASVGDQAIVRGSAVLYGRTRVLNYSLVEGHALICGFGKAKEGVIISGNTRISGYATILGSIVLNGSYPVAHLIENGVPKTKCTYYDYESQENKEELIQGTKPLKLVDCTTQDEDVGSYISGHSYLWSEDTVYYRNVTIMDAWCSMNRINNSKNISFDDMYRNREIYIYGDISVEDMSKLMLSIPSDENQMLIKDGSHFRFNNRKYVINIDIEKREWKLTTNARDLLYHIKTNSVLVPFATEQALLDEGTPESLAYLEKLKNSLAVRTKYTARVVFTFFDEDNNQYWIKYDREVGVNIRHPSYFGPIFQPRSDTGNPDDYITADPVFLVFDPLVDYDDPVFPEFSIDGGVNWNPCLFSIDGLLSSFSPEVSKEKSITEPGRWFFSVPDGTYDTERLKVRYIDANGITGASSRLKKEITIDTGMDAPDWKFVNDTGYSDTDLISSEGELDVSFKTSDKVIKVIFSLDGGITWKPSESSMGRILLEEGVYEPGEILTRATDLAGNTITFSNPTKIVVDKTVSIGMNYDEENHNKVINMMYPNGDLEPMDPEDREYLEGQYVERLKLIFELESPNDIIRKILVINSGTETKVTLSEDQIKEIKILDGNRAEVSIDVTSIPDGLVNAVASVEDESGNKKLVTQTFLKDVITKMTIDLLDLHDRGIDADDYITNIDFLRFTGEVENGASLDIFHNGLLVKTFKHENNVRLDGNRLYFDVDLFLIEGMNNVLFYAYDTYGNINKRKYNIIVDLTSPTYSFSQLPIVFEDGTMKVEGYTNEPTMALFKIVQAEDLNEQEEYGFSEGFHAERTKSIFNGSSQYPDPFYRPDQETGFIRQEFTTAQLGITSPNDLVNQTHTIEQETGNLVYDVEVFDVGGNKSTEIILTMKSSGLSDLNRNGAGYLKVSKRIRKESRKSEDIRILNERLFDSWDFLKNLKGRNENEFVTLGEIKASSGVIDLNGGNLQLQTNSMHTKEFTVFTTVKIPSLATYSYNIIFNYENDFELAIATSGGRHTLRWAIFGNANVTSWAWIDTGVEVTPNKWYNVGFVCGENPERVSLYLDGDLVYAYEFTRYVVNSCDTFTIGGRSCTMGTAGANLSLSVKNVTLWNKALSQKQINFIETRLGEGRSFLEVSEFNPETDDVDIFASDVVETKKYISGRGITIFTIGYANELLSIKTFDTYGSNCHDEIMEELETITNSKIVYKVGLITDDSFEGNLSVDTIYALSYSLDIPIQKLSDLINGRTGKPHTSFRSSLLAFSERTSSDWKNDYAGVFKSIYSQYAPNGSNGIYYRIPLHRIMIDIGMVGNRNCSMVSSRDLVRELAGYWVLNGNNSNVVGMQSISGLGDHTLSNGKHEIISSVADSKYLNSPEFATAMKITYISREYANSADPLTAMGVIDPLEKQTLIDVKGAFSIGFTRTNPSMDYSVGFLYRENMRNNSSPLTTIINEEYGNADLTQYRNSANYLHPFTTRVNRIPETITAKLGWGGELSVNGIWEGETPYSARIDKSISIYFPISANYIFKSIVDDVGNVYLDGTDVMGSIGLGSYVTKSYFVSEGMHTIKITGSNGGKAPFKNNPAQFYLDIEIDPNTVIDYSEFSGWRAWGQNAIVSRALSKFKTTEYPFKLVTEKYRESRVPFNYKYDFTSETNWEDTLSQPLDDLIVIGPFSSATEKLTKSVLDRREVVWEIEATGAEAGIDPFGFACHGADFMIDDAIVLEDNQVTSPFNFGFGDTPGKRWIEEGVFLEGGIMPVDPSDPFAVKVFAASLPHTGSLLEGNYDSAWSPQMNSYAVWPEEDFINATQGKIFTVKRQVNIEEAGTYRLWAQGDNFLKWFIDDSLVIETADFATNLSILGRTGSRRIHLDAGIHEFKFECYNQPANGNNPAGYFAGISQYWPLLYSVTSHYWGNFSVAVGSSLQMNDYAVWFEDNGTGNATPDKEFSVTRTIFVNSTLVGWWDWYACCDGDYFHCFIDGSLVVELTPQFSEPGRPSRRQGQVFLSAGEHVLRFVSNNGDYPELDAVQGNNPAGFALGMNPNGTQDILPEPPSDFMIHTRQLLGPDIDVVYWHTRMNMVPEVRRAQTVQQTKTFTFKTKARSYLPYKTTPTKLSVKTQSGENYREKDIIRKTISFSASGNCDHTLSFSVALVFRDDSEEELDNYTKTISWSGRNADMVAAFSGVGAAVDGPHESNHGHISGSGSATLLNLRAGPLDDIVLGDITIVSQSSSGIGTISPPTKDNGFVLSYSVYTPAAGEQSYSCSFTMEVEFLADVAVPKLTEYDYGNSLTIRSIRGYLVDSALNKKECIYDNNLVKSTSPDGMFIDLGKEKTFELEEEVVDQIIQFAYSPIEKPNTIPTEPTLSRKIDTSAYVGEWVCAQFDIYLFDTGDILSAVNGHDAVVIHIDGILASIVSRSTPLKDSQDNSYSDTLWIYKDASEPEDVSLGRPFNMGLAQRRIIDVTWKVKASETTITLTGLLNQNVEDESWGLRGFKLSRYNSQEDMNKLDQSRDVLISLNGNTDTDNASQISPAGGSIYFSGTAASGDCFLKIDEMFFGAPEKIIIKTLLFKKLQVGICSDESTIFTIGDASEGSYAYLSVKNDGTVMLNVNGSTTASTPGRYKFGMVNAISFEREGSNYCITIESLGNTVIENETKFVVANKLFEQECVSIPSGLFDLPLIVGQRFTTSTNIVSEVDHSTLSTDSHMMTGYLIEFSIMGASGSRTLGKHNIPTSLGKQLDGFTSITSHPLQTDPPTTVLNAFVDPIAHFLRTGIGASRFSLDATKEEDVKPAHNGMIWMNSGFKIEQDKAYVLLYQYNATQKRLDFFIYEEDNMASITIENLEPTFSVLADKLTVPNLADRITLVDTTDSNVSSAFTKVDNCNIQDLCLWSRTLKPDEILCVLKTISMGTAPITQEMVSSFVDY